jgi:hypothetical protein
MLMNVRIPHEEFNECVRNGSAGDRLRRILEEIKPEAVYFTEHDGQRGAVIIVDVPDPSRIPTLAEPWYLTFDADVEFRVAMTPEDLQRSDLEQAGKKW